MAQEKEIKIKLKIPLKEFKQRLIASGYQLKGKSEQLDIYFDKPDWYLYENISALRIRITNGKDHLFSFKKIFYLPNKKDPYYIEEIEVPFPIKDSENFKQILKKLNLKIEPKFPLNVTELTKILIDSGFQDEQKMPKIREKYVLDDTEVLMDEIDKVGIILELECKESDPHIQVNKLLKENEWERSIEGTGYIWLRVNKGFTSHIENFKKFKNQPDWNVWEHERDFYQSISE